ncbi:MAG: ABC transporter ATP-binding protein [Armatimonadetes bacterium]|nr:ABC transporter ATP-binding protein [Armatimonadota bacterium]
MLIEVKGLSKKYGSKLAVNDISFSLEGGDVYGFIGPNGAGKTTTLRILATLLTYDSGEITLGGHPIREAQTVRKIIGYLPDHLGMYEKMTVREYLEFFGKAYKLDPYYIPHVVKEVTEITQTQNWLDMHIESLSRGMRQRLGLAKTLVHDPPILLLDEPASGMDPKSRVDLRELIKILQAKGKAIMISSHILPELADFCNKVGIIDNGRLLYSGSTDDLLRKIQKDRWVTLKTTGPVETAEEVLDRCDQVTEVRKTNGVLKFAFNGTDGDLSALLRTLVAREIPVVNFAEEEKDLEGAYLKIVG